MIDAREIGRKAYCMGSPLTANPFTKQRLSAWVAWSGGWMQEHDADGGLTALRHGMARDLVSAGHSKQEAMTMVGLKRPAKNQQEKTRAAIDASGRNALTSGFSQPRSI